MSCLDAVGAGSLDLLLAATLRSQHADARTSSSNKDRERAVPEDLSLALALQPVWLRSSIGI